MSDDGVRHFVLNGWTEDGRKWYEIVHLTDELIAHSGPKLLTFILQPVQSWDARHKCTTRRVTFRQFSELAWAEFTGDWNA